MKTTKRTHAVVSLGVIALALMATTGCSNMNGGRISARPVIVNESQLTPAQKQAKFAEAYRAGMMYARQRAYPEAMAAFEEASKMRPDSTEALFNLAACYESVGDPLRAIGIYNRILRLTPDDADCYHNLGTSYMKLYYLQKSESWKRMAITAWENSLKLRPDQPKIKAYLARSGDEL